MSAEQTWTPPQVLCEDQVPGIVFDWWKAKCCAVLSTTSRGLIHSSVMWFLPEPNCIRFATVIGRQKYRDIIENPNLSILFHFDDDWDRYVEIRGEAELIGDGRDLIDRLYSHFRSPGRYPWDAPQDERVEVRVRIRKILVFGMD